MNKIINKIKSLFKRSACKTYEMTFYGICHSRHTYNKKNLKKKDFILGFGNNSDLINKIHYARVKYNEQNPDKKLPLRDDLRQQYDNRIGCYITGEKIKTRLHPLHNKQLMNIKTKEKYIIDVVIYEHFYGNFLSLLVRKEGSLSHGEILWENYSCHFPAFVNKININKKKYILIDKFDPFTL